MIKFEKFVLNNGLVVITHQDTTTPMAAVNVLYKVGSRNEIAENTGFAHLFEHLMFGGSANVPDFDEVIQLAGGENNAFTNSDFTNYYEVIPADNIESALWVEADRMANLIISKNSLDIQRKVVVEEFKEVCLNTPYGDTWHHISELSYSKHPYNWPTIGKKPEHIENASIEDVRQFYSKYYNPNNAILSIASPLSHIEMRYLAEKWFGEIKSPSLIIDKIDLEPPQSHKRESEIISDVPLRALYMAFHMPDRLNPKFYACDLLSDLFAGGKSSRFYQQLVKKNQFFSNINAYISGTFDPGLFIIDCKPMPDVDNATAIALIWDQIDQIKKGDIRDNEITKIKNKLTTEIILSNLDILNKSMILSYFEALGDANYANDQLKRYSAITKEDVVDIAQEILLEENLNELTYIPSQN